MYFVSWLSWPKETGILCFVLPQRCNPQALVLDKSIIHFKDKALLRTRAV